MELIMDKTLLSWTSVPLVVLDLENQSGYYYFLHESDNSKIIIFNTVDNSWSAIHSSGSNFSSPSINQLVNPITVANSITGVRESYDGKEHIHLVQELNIEQPLPIIHHLLVLQPQLH